MHKDISYIVSGYNGFFVVKSKDVDLIHDVEIYNYFNGLKTVLDLAEKQVKENNCCMNVLLYICKLRDLIEPKSDLNKLTKEDKANIAFLIWTIYQPINYLGSELSFIISFFIYFKEDIKELKYS